MLKISLIDTQRDLSFSMYHMKKVISFLLKILKISTDEVIFHFVTDPKIREIHKEFFNDPSSTDCITFPLDPPEKRKNSYHVLGEAFICPKIALSYAKKRAIDPYEELCRYVVHCLLHMIGYDDIESGERAKMKRRERNCLKKLKEEGLLNKSLSKSRVRKKRSKIL